MDHIPKKPVLPYFIQRNDCDITFSFLRSILAKLCMSHVNHPTTSLVDRSPNLYIPVLANLQYFAKIPRLNQKLRPLPCRNIGNANVGNRCLQYIGQKLHQKAVGGDSTVHLQFLKFPFGLTFYGTDHILYLEGY